MKEDIEKKLEKFENRINNQEFKNFAQLVIEFKTVKIDLEVYIRNHCFIAIP